MIDAHVIEKLKAGCTSVAPGSPASLPFLEGLDAFLQRWFGVGMDTAKSFEYGHFTEPSGEGTGYVEVTIETPFDSLSGWWWEGVMEGFGVNGLMAVDLNNMPIETFERSACKARWLVARDEIDGDDADVRFWITREGDGTVVDKFRTFRDRPREDRNG